MPLERDVQEAILKLLRATGLGARKITVPVRRGATAGVPDIYTTLPGGIAFWIEVKAERGRVRPEQEEFIGWVTQHGAVAIVARSVEDVRAVLSRYGVLA